MLYRHMPPTLVQNPILQQRYMADEQMIKFCRNTNTVTKEQCTNNQTKFLYQQLTLHTRHRKCNMGNQLI